MMNGDMWGGWMGGYGAMWMPILLVIVVDALVVWDVDIDVPDRSNNIAGPRLTSRASHIETHKDWRAH